MKNDTIVVTRNSKETEIELKLRLVPGSSEIRSGIGFLDHLLSSLAYHAGWTLQLSCRGDLEVDDHHSAEDTAIVLGLAFKEALADQENPRRFGTAYAPLDEALARAVVDLSGRPWCQIDLGFKRERIGIMATENIGHVLQSFAINAGICLHVDLLKGDNDHHKAEAAFKALALALKTALMPLDGSSNKGLAEGPEAIRENGASPLNSTKGRPSLSLTRIQESASGKSR
jgi:imidazoleglycerol-phosphate dehydratase